VRLACAGPARARARWWLPPAAAAAGPRPAAAPLAPTPLPAAASAAVTHALQHCPLGSVSVAALLQVRVSGPHRPRGAAARGAAAGDARGGVPWQPLQSTPRAARCATGAAAGTCKSVGVWRHGWRSNGGHLAWTHTQVAARAHLCGRAHSLMHTCAMNHSLNPPAGQTYSQQKLGSEPMS